MHVAVTYENAFSTDVSLCLNSVDEDYVLDCLDGRVRGINSISAVDISFENSSGEEIEPTRNVMVTMSTESPVEGDRFMLVHITDDGQAFRISENNIEEITIYNTVFYADIFSVYAVLGINDSSDSGDAQFSDPLPLPALTGDYRTDYVAVAKSQIGYNEADDGSSYYGNWLDQTYRDWCSEFAAWCAYAANIPETIIPHVKSSKRYIEFFAPKGRYYYIDGGILSGETSFMMGYSFPQVITIQPSEIEYGDIILKETNGDNDDGPDHTAIFLSYEGDGVVNYISGNDSDTVKINSCNISQLHGVCKPDFNNSDSEQMQNTVVSSQDDSDDENGSQESSADSITLDVSSHSQDEIKSRIRSSGIGSNENFEYDVTPSFIMPYSLGSLSASTKNKCIAMLNNIRYVAGLQDVSWDDSYGEYAQAAALVDAAIGQLTHYPSRPEGMSDDLYELGSTGAHSCNLGMGYRTIDGVLLYGWLHDGDDSNIDRVGHRRWALNPSMGKTGFGKVGSFSSMYAFDKSADSDINLVSWPAQQMPLEYFDDDSPWSLSSSTIFTGDNISVKLKRTNDGREWYFSNSSNSNNSGYFNVNNANYGLPGCIIFRPNNISYNNGDRFEVLVSGTSIPQIRYFVTFFSLDNSNNSASSNNSSSSNGGSYADNSNGYYYNSNSSYVPEYISNASGNTYSYNSGRRDIYYSYSYDDDDDEDEDSNDIGKSGDGNSFDKGDSKIAGSKTSKAVYTKTGNSTVRYEDARIDSKSKTAWIPKKVAIDGKNYKVTSVAEDAFIACDNLETVVVGKNVKKINDSAFGYSEKLKSITVNSKKLKAKNIKNSFRESNISTVYTHPDIINDYRKIFTKSNTGNKRNITVKGK